MYINQSRVLAAILLILLLFQRHVCLSVLEYDVVLTDFLVSDPSYSFHHDSFSDILRNFSVIVWSVVDLVPQ